MNRFPLVAFWGVLLGAGWLLWHDARHTLAPLPVSGPTSATRVVTGSTVAPAVALADLPIFGAVLAGAPATPAEIAPPTATRAELLDTDLPLTTADYHLYGVIAASSVAPRRAILGTTDADQHDYAEGAVAPDGAVIRAIGVRSIVLELNGTLARLELVQPSSVAVANAAPDSLVPPSAGAVVAGDSPIARIKARQAARRAAPNLPPSASP